MPRPKAEEPRDCPLLIRITAQQRTVLEAVAHLEGATPNAYAHQVLIEHLASVVSNKHVQVDIANRRSYEATATEATPIRKRARQS